MARYNPFPTYQEPSYDYGDYGEGGRQGPEPPPTGGGRGRGPTVITLPTGEMAIVQPGAWKLDPFTGERYQEPDTYLRIGRPPTGGQGRDPGLARGTELENRLRELQIDAYPEDRQMQRDIGYGNLGISQGRLALDERFGVQDREFRDAVQKWQEARDARDFEAMQFWKQKAYALDERAAARADQELGLKAELGYAESRRGDARVLFEEADLYGQDREGRQTAKAKQQAFQNTYMVGQDAANRGERGQARADRLRQIEAEAVERARARTFDEGAVLRGEQERQRRSDVDVMIAGRQPAARTITMRGPAFRPY